MKFLDCSSTLRKKRAAISQTQHVTLTTATAEKFDVESIAMSNQSNSNKAFSLFIILSAITQYSYMYFWYILEDKNNNKNEK